MLPDAELDCTENRTSNAVEQHRTESLPLVFCIFEANPLAI